MSMMALSTLPKNTVLGANMFINDQYGAIYNLNGNYWDEIIWSLPAFADYDDIFIRLSL